MLTMLSYFPRAPSFLGKAGKRLGSVSLRDGSRKIGPGQTRARYIFALEAGEETLFQVDETTMFRKLMSIHRREFYWFWSNFLLTTYAFMDDSFDLEELESRFREGLRCLIGSLSPELYVVRARTPKDFPKAIQKFVR